jgi:hypothetical protein
MKHNNKNSRLGYSTAGNFSQAVTSLVPCTNKSLSQADTLSLDCSLSPLGSRFKGGQLLEPVNSPHSVLEFMYCIENETTEHERTVLVCITVQFQQYINGIETPKAERIQHQALDSSRSSATRSIFCSCSSTALLMGRILGLHNTSASPPLTKHGNDIIQRRPHTTESMGQIKKKQLKGRS